MLAKNVRRLPGSGGDAGSDTAASDSDGQEPLERGDKVEGNYKNKGKWFKGKISRVNADSTYDILYNDGGRSSVSELSRHVVCVVGWR